PPHALPGEAAHQGQRLPWLTPNDAQRTWSTLRDSRSSWTLRPCPRTVCTAHTGSTLLWDCNPCRGPHLGHGAALAWQALGVRERLLAQARGAVWPCGRPDAAGEPDPGPW